MFENIFQWWSDFRYTQAFKYTVLILVLLCLCIGLFVANNFTSNQKTNVGEEQVLPKKSLVKNFGESTNLIKISDTSARYGDLYFFDNKVTFLSQDLKLIQAGSVLQSKNMFIPNTIYQLEPNSLLVNQDNSSTILNTKDGIDEPITSSITNITPIKKLSNSTNSDGFSSGFIYLQKRIDSLVIKQANDLNFGDSKTLVEINPTEINIDSILQIRNFNDKPYLISSTLNNKNLKNITIYEIQINEKKTTKKFSFTDVFSEYYGTNKLLFSTQDQAKLIVTNILDFDSTNPTKSTINPKEELLSAGIKGSIIAQKCSTSATKPKMICMVKEQETQYWNSDEKDSFVEYNTQTGNITVLYEGLNISAHTVVYSPKDEVYIFGEENNLVYQVR